MLREYPEDDVSCWRANVAGHYDADMLQGMLDQLREPLEKPDRRGLKIRVYRRPALGHVYCLGVDPAGMPGKGKDSVGMFLLDVTAGWQAASILGQCDPDTAVEEMALLAERYYHAMTVIELTGLGLAYVAPAMKAPGLRLWKRPRRPTESPDLVSFIKRTPGLSVDAPTRALMQGRTLTMVNRGNVLLADKELIEHLMSWDPLTERHLDDMHSAFQLAAWGQEEALRLAPAGAMRPGAEGLQEPRPVGTPPWRGEYFHAA